MFEFSIFLLPVLFFPETESAQVTQTIFSNQLAGWLAQTLTAAVEMERLPHFPSERGTGIILSSQTRFLQQPSKCFVLSFSASELSTVLL